MNRRIEHWGYRAAPAPNSRWVAPADLGNLDIHPTMRQLDDDLGGRRAVID